MIYDVYLDYKYTGADPTSRDMATTFPIARAAIFTYPKGLRHVPGTAQSSVQAEVLGC